MRLRRTRIFSNPSDTVAYPLSLLSYLALGFAGPDLSVALAHHVLTLSIHMPIISRMDTTYELNGIEFCWDARKARTNIIKHNVSFELAATVFFDPFFRLVDASVTDEARDAVIGFDESQRLLYVVHIEVDEAGIRIISARKATAEERRTYDQ